MPTNWKHIVRRKLAPLRLPPQRENAIVEELSQHLDDCYAESLAGGVTEGEAYRAALAELSESELLQRELLRVERQVTLEPIILGTNRRTNMIADLWQDLHFGLRLLVKDRAFTLVAALSLALGIGANTALFSLVDAVLLKRLPVKQPEDLVLFSWLSGPKAMSRGIDGHTSTDQATGMRTSASFSFLSFERLRDHNRTLSDLFAFAPIQQLNVIADGQAEIAKGQFVTGGYYAALSVPMSLGRPITDADDQLNAEPVAVISHRYWQRRFAGHPAVVGKTVTVNKTIFTIVGVTPPEFFGTLQVGQSPDVTVPMSMEPRLGQGTPNISRPTFWWVRVMGRLKPGVTAEQARVDLEGVFQQSALEGWQAASAKGDSSREPRDVPLLRVAPGGQGLMELRRDYSQPLRILLAMVVLVLLVACANVANLLLARSAARRKEIAVRLALGASRWRLVRQLLTESVLLAALGGALGIVFAVWFKDALLALRPWGGGALVLDLRLDWRVLSFTATASLLTGLLFGLAPALRATRVNLTPALKDDARNLSGGVRLPLGKSLLVAQVAMSLVLLIGAGLFVRTLRNLQSVDVGFNRDNLLLFRVDAGLNGYRGVQAATLYQRLIERIEAVPGVRSATLARHPLLSGSRRSDSISVQGHTPPPGAGNSVYVNLVEAGFFETMEMPVLSGRALSSRDDEHASPVAVINQTMARKYFGDQNPVGRRFGFGGDAENSGKVEIVGLVRDAKYDGLREETPPTVYVPFLQEIPSQVNFSVRTVGEPGALITVVRQAVREVDGNLPLFDVKTQREQAAELVMQERLFAHLTSFFGLLALALVSIGLYGVLAYSVAGRTREIGIRMALGAERRDVLRLVLKQGLTLAFIGAALGLAAAFALMRTLTSLLFGVTPTDPLTLVMVVLLLAGVAFVACWIPARRATKVDPMIALRTE